jgi:hypothetical protein
VSFANKPWKKRERTKLLRCTTQFSQIINAALFMLHSFKGIIPNPPSVLLVGSESKAANPHATSAPANKQKVKSKRQHKNPGTPPNIPRALFQSINSNNRRQTP